MDYNSDNNNEDIILNSENTENAENIGNTENIENVEITPLINLEKI